MNKMSCLRIAAVVESVFFFLQLARIMAVLQQQRQQQQQQHLGGTVGGSKLSPSHLGGSGPKMPMSDAISHPGLAGSVADLHQKTQGTYSGEIFHIVFISIFPIWSSDTCQPNRKMQKNISRYIILSNISINH